MFVNVSAAQLADPRFADDLSAAVTRRGLPRGSLGLEAPESGYTDPLVAARLAEQHERGHPLAIDDFGTGSLSLTDLIDVPAEFVKIDRSVVAEFVHNRSRSLFDAISAVCQGLGVAVVAKGVETRQQAQLLGAAGCDLVQGFHVAEPRPATELTDRWFQPAVR